MFLYSSHKFLSSVSYKDYNSLDEYMNDMESGFGFEYKNPNFDKRIWNI